MRNSRKCYDLAKKNQRSIYHNESMALEHSGSKSLSTFDQAGIQAYGISASATDPEP